MSLSDLIIQRNKKRMASLEDASQSGDDPEKKEDDAPEEGGDEGTEGTDDGSSDDEDPESDADNDKDDPEEEDDGDDDSTDSTDSNDDSDDDDDDLFGEGEGDGEDDSTEGEDDGVVEGPENTDLDETEVEKEVVYESAELDEVSRDIADHNDELDEIEEEDEEIASLESALDLMSKYGDVSEMAINSPTAGISVETAVVMSSSLEAFMGKQTSGKLFVGAESFTGNSKRSNLTEQSKNTFELSVESANLSAWDQTKNIIEMVQNWFTVEGKLATKLKAHADALANSEVSAVHDIAMGKGQFNSLAIGGNMGNIAKNLKALIKIAKEVTSEKKDIDYISALMGVEFKAGNDEEFEASRAKLLDVMTSQFPKWSFITKTAPDDDRTKEALAVGLEVKASEPMMGDYQIISMRDATGAKTIEGSANQGFLWHDIRNNQVRGKQKIKSLNSKELKEVASLVSELLEILINSKTSEQLSKLRQEVKGAVASYKKLSDKELAKGNSVEFRQLNRAIRGNVRALSVARTSFIAHAFQVASSALEYCNTSVEADKKAAKAD